MVRSSSELVTSRGQRKSFHANRKLKIASVAKAGMESGTMMRKNVPMRLQPSMRAASSSSTGIEAKYWRNRMMPKTSASRGTISAV